MLILDKARTGWIAWRTWLFAVGVLLFPLLPCLVHLAHAQPAASAPPVAGGPAAGASVKKANPAIFARTDWLWKKRDEAAAFAEMRTLIDRGLVEAPGDYDVLWRASIWYFWASDDPQRPREERTRLAKVGWDLGERAVAANPAGVEGQFFTATNMGNYSLGIGVLRALAQRIEGKFVARLREAERLQPTFANGSIPVTWGRYYATLPWPKHDAKKAIAAFQRAIAINPHNLRARVYWAEVALDEDQPQEAKRLLDEVAKAPAGQYDAPEERRAKLLGTMLMPKVQAALKG